ncbi:MAG: hypothetical protein LBU56_00270 [Rickettsiales bacterium]|jgi:hypothetical protein|nr:hypothetical protein [Rickettsiales bacterium]
MFANIKRNYKSIEERLGSNIHINPGLPFLLGLVDETFGHANFKAKLSRSLLLDAAAKGNIEG